MTNNTKHEDALLKMGIGYFREHILKTLGIEYEYIDTGSTEVVYQQVDFLNNLTSKFLISTLSSVAVATATPLSSALK